MKKRDEKPKKPEATKAGTPTGAFIHDEIFTSAEEAARAIAASVQFIKSFSASRESEGTSNKIGFVIESIQVSFQKNIDRVRLVTKFASDSATIIFPIKGTESESVLREIELKVLAEFLPALPDAQMRSALQFYRTLDPRGRRDLEERFGQDVTEIISQFKTKSKLPVEKPRDSDK